MSQIVDGSFYVHTVEEWMSDPRTCSETLLDHYQVQNLEGFGLSENSPLTIAAGTIINYVRQTRPGRAGAHQAAAGLSPGPLHGAGPFNLAES